MPLQTPDPFELAARRFERTGAALFYNDPVGFAQKMILWPPDQGLTPYQAEILGRIVSDRRVAVRGPHGLGKTGLKALAVLWFACTREAMQVDWKCLTTAGAWRQLINYLWPEIHKWVGRLNWELLGISPWVRDKQLLDLSIKLFYGQAFAVASSHKELIEGAHADSILYIFDESKAIKAGIWEAAEGAFSGQGEAFALASSTPGDPSGVFYSIHSHKPGLEDWTARHVTFHEARAAGRVSLEWALQRAKQWGGCAQRLIDREHRCDQGCTQMSAVFANRVLGEFHSSDEDTVIPLAWVEAAIERWYDWDGSGRPMPVGRQVVGVDVARGGAAKTVCAPRIGHVVFDLYDYTVADTVKVAALVMSRHMLNQTDLAVIDVIGVGAGVGDIIRNTPDKEAILFSASRSTKRRDRSGQLGFRNQRAFMWWRLRELLDPAFSPTLCLPPSDLLIGDLTAPKWWVTPGNQIQIESKEDIETRIGRSTDYGDAVCQSLLTEAEFNSVESDPIPLQYTDAPNDLAFAWEGSNWYD